MRMRCAGWQEGVRQGGMAVRMSEEECTGSGVCVDTGEEITGATAQAGCFLEDARICLLESSDAGVERYRRPQEAVCKQAGFVCIRLWPENRGSRRETSGPTCHDEE